MSDESEIQVPKLWSHARYFGDETYIIVAHYNSERNEEICLGRFETLSEANEFLEKLPYYSNIRGKQIFTGARVLTVPQDPLGPESGYWKYQLLEKDNEN